MKPRNVRPIPEDTASAGKAIFKKGAFYQNVGDQLGELCRECDPTGDVSKPNVTIPILFLVTVFQYLESLSNSQAAAAVLDRVDWKYALHLPLISLGFDEKGLEEYHRKLLADPAVQTCLNNLLQRVQDLYALRATEAKKVDTASMMSAVNTLNRLSQVVRAMRLALEDLAIYHPQWLKQTVLPHWLQRYSRSNTDGKIPEAAQKRDSLALAVGEDGFFLLDALEMKGAPADARNLPEIEYLRHVWNRQFVRTAGKVKWRSLPSRTDT